jgi:YVTN family beta-propeller protein
MIPQHPEPFGIATISDDKERPMKHRIHSVIEIGRRSLMSRKGGFGLLALLAVTALFLAGILALPVAGKSGGLASANGILWVTNTATNRVTVYEAATGALITSIGVGKKPLDITSPQGTGKVYVSNESDNTVSVISKDSLSVIKTIATGPKPHHMHHSHNGKFVYVAEFGTNKVGVIDTTSDTLVAEFETGSPDTITHAVWATDNGKTLLATNTKTKGLAALDAKTGEIKWVLPLEHDPSDVVSSRNSKVAYVSIRDFGNPAPDLHKVKVIDLETQAVLANIPLSTQPTTMRLSTNGKQLAVTLHGVGALAVVDLRNNNAVELVQLGGTPSHNAMSTNGRYSFVTVGATALATPGVAVIDMRSLEVVEYYPDPFGGSPHGIFYDNERRSEESEEEGE